MAIAAEQLRADAPVSENETAQHPSYGYRDALCGRIPLPAVGEPGKLIFTVMMVASMVTFMCLFNGSRHYDWNVTAFFLNAHWLFPLIFIVALSVRLSLADAITGKIIPSVIAPNFDGIAKTALITLANVTVMCPIMSALATLLLNGFDNYGYEYITALAAAYPVALCLNFFIVGPAVKCGFYKLMYSKRGVHFLGWFKANVMPVLYFFNS